MKNSTKSVALAVISGGASMMATAAFPSDVTTPAGAVGLAIWGVGLVGAIIGVSRYADEQSGEYQLSGDYLDLLGEFAIEKRRFAGWEFCSSFRKRVVAEIESMYGMKKGSLVLTFSPGGETDSIKMQEAEGLSNNSLFNSLGREFSQFLNEHDKANFLRTYKETKAD